MSWYIVDDRNEVEKISLNRKEKPQKWFVEIKFNDLKWNFYVKNETKWGFVFECEKKKIELRKAWMDTTIGRTF